MSEVYSKAKVKEASDRMGREPINPIGTCFDSAAFQIVRGPLPGFNVKLCHGVGVTNMPGEEPREMAHAWIEADKDGKRMAFDTTWGVCQYADNYRRAMEINMVVTYSRRAFMRLWKRHDHPGPYNKDIRKFCSDIRDAGRQLNEQP